MEDLESRLTLNGEETFQCIGLENFSFEMMAKTHKPAVAPRQDADDQVDYGARRTVDPKGVCHAEKDAEKYFTFGKNERVPGFSRRPNRPDYEAYIDPEMEAGCQAGASEPQRDNNGHFPPDAKQYRDHVLAAAQVAAREGTSKRQAPGRFKIKVLGIPAQTNSFIIFRRKNFGDWIKHGDPSPLLLAEVDKVNDKYEDPLSWQPSGPKAENGPWRYYVTRWDLHQRAMNKVNSNFTLYKAQSRFHPAILEKQSSTGVSPWFFTKEEIEELGKTTAKRAWGYSRSYIDFNSGDFILLKQMALFTSPPLENLFASELKALLKMDKEFREWYADVLLDKSGNGVPKQPRSHAASDTGSGSSSSSSSSAAAAADTSNRSVDVEKSSDREEALQLCLVEAVEKQFHEDEGGRFSENEDVEDWRFIQHARNTANLDGYQQSDNILALLDRTAPDVDASDDDDHRAQQDRPLTSSSSSAAAVGESMHQCNQGSAASSQVENRTMVTKKKAGRPKKKANK